MCIPCMLLSQLSHTLHVYFTPALLAIPVAAFLQLLLSRVIAGIAAKTVLTEEEMNGRASSGGGAMETAVLRGSVG